MQRGMMVLLFAGLLFATSCASQDTPEARPVGGLAPYQVTEELQLSIATRPDLVAWHRDVVVTCSGPRDEALSGCEVQTVSSGGTLVETGISGVRAARRVKAGILVVHANRDLVLVEGDGNRRTIASLAANPGVSQDGQRVAFVQGKVPATRILSYDFGSGETLVVTTDPGAYAPHPVPGSDDVLFVSGRTGVASYWLADKNGAERQLTNVGLTEVTKGFVPLAVSQLVWLPGTTSCVFTAHYDSDVLWKLDVKTGRGDRLGPGSFPNLEAGGSVLALDRGLPHVERAPRVARYLGGV